MTASDTIRILLARGARALGELDASQWQRVAARAAWARETAAAWHDAMRQMDERCTAAVGRLDEEDFTRLFDAEQAKVDAIRAQLDAAIENDLWPRELYFGGI